MDVDVTAFDTLSLIHFVWAGLVVLTLLLLALMSTRWGQSQPLGKCAFLSLLAHLLLGIYSTTVPMVHASLGYDASQELAISSVEQVVEIDPDELAAERAQVPQFDPDEIPESDNAPMPVVEPVARELATPMPIETSRPAPLEPIPQPPELSRLVDSLFPQREERPELPPLPDPAPIHPPEARRTATPEPSPAKVAVESAAPSPDETPEVPKIEASAAAQGRQPARPVDARPEDTAKSDVAPAQAGPVRREPAPPIRDVERAVSSATPQAAAPLKVGRARTALDPLPAMYQLRVSVDRPRVVAKNGGSEQTEAAVNAALAWLAANQNDDGRWDARRHGGGRELMVLGRDRGGAGAKADTGITGLALLAFLGAGHTHRQGDHRAAVRKGVEFLLASQASDGSLAGGAELYAHMYCHGMASFALSECYAMTGDPALESGVKRALRYIVNSQHPANGGWRYHPGDRGDTSVLGWQLMALKSGDAAGIPIPADTREGMVRYLKSVSQGRHGGLASYRAGELESRTMTAEALASRQFLGMSRQNPAGDEAGDYLLGELPSHERVNYYYWYYGTLASYQLGGRHWKVWNTALSRTLLDSQKTTGDLAGSWEPNDVWGGYGGRVYSTSTAALCLEVYYRYLPLYQEVSKDE
jgi:hypothetical protein